jgi:hypothetical protein
MVGTFFLGLNGLSFWEQVAQGLLGATESWSGLSSGFSGNLSGLATQERLLCCFLGSKLDRWGLSTSLGHCEPSFPVRRHILLLRAGGWGCPSTSQDSRKVGRSPACFLVGILLAKLFWLSCPIASWCHGEVGRVGGTPWIVLRPGSAECPQLPECFTVSLVRGSKDSFL